MRYAAALRHASAAVLLVLCTAGCKQTDNSKSTFTSALNSYFAANPECLWTDPQKLPAQSDTNGGADTAKYDALVDAGLLTRTSAEKQKLIVLTKQINIYDLSPNGRAVWVGDAQQPGYGNLCYGHRKVDDVTAFTSTGTQPGATASTTYTWHVSDAAAWASAAETQTAFPGLASAISGPNVAQATLVLTTDGWKVQAPARHTRGAATAADGKIVE